MKLEVDDISPKNFSRTIYLLHNNTKNTHLKYSIIIETHVKANKESRKPI